MKSDLLSATLQQIQDTLRDTNRPPKELRMHPDDVRELELQCSKYGGLARTENIDVRRFEGIDVIMDPSVPRLPRK